MRRVVVILALALGLAGAHAFAAEPKIEKRSIVSDGKTRTYYRYAPSGVVAGRAAPVPLLVTLHGSGRDGRILVEKWKKLADKERIVLVGPDSTSRETWNTDGDGPAFFHDLVEETRRDLPIDGRRIYLFGHSAGAVFALTMASLESEYFAAAVAHAGALQIQYHSVFGYATRKTPILLVVGSRDLLFPVSNVQATHEALVARGFPAEFHEIPNHTHDYYGRSGEINRRAWSFLTRHALGQEPKYTVYAR